MVAVPDLKTAPGIAKPGQVSVIGRVTYTAGCYREVPKPGNMPAGDLC